MNIIGLGGSTHDFSAALVVDGKLKYAIEDERITRKKHSLNIGSDVFRTKAVEYCLNAQKINVNDIDLFICSDIVAPLYYFKYKDRIKLMNHHLAHACSAFYPSPFDNAAIMVMDGRGSAIDKNHNKEAITYYYGDNNKITEIKKVCGLENPLGESENSLGVFYSNVTREIGFGFLDDGKTMGLAPYGTNKFIDPFSDFYLINEDGDFIQSIEQVKEMRKYIRGLLEGINETDKKLQTMADIAFAAQYHLEKIIINSAQYLYRKTHAKNLCLAGGVALNSVANYKILQNTSFENVFIQPAAGDSGTAIGSALYGYYEIVNEGKKPRSLNKCLFSPYLGVDYTITLDFFNKYKEKINIHETIEEKELNSTVAQYLADGKIIGWFQGRSEIGPRALGNRSILADSRRKDMKELINSRIKHRESFRPFAPIILEEKQENYFLMSHPSYYMLIVADILDQCQAQIPSVTHVDGTGRIQTVSKHLNRRLHALLTEFDNLTGVPVLLNTSFNDNGEPIVETPENALECFLKIDLDYLIINQFIISKKGDV